VPKSAPRIKPTKKSVPKGPLRSKNIKSPPKDVLLLGAAGRMGLELIKLLNADTRYRLGAAVDTKDIKVFDDQHTAVLASNQKSLNAVAQGAAIVIDFSSPKATMALARSLQFSQDQTVLIGTTGLGAQHFKTLKDAAKKGGHRILVAGNTSLGIATLARLAILAASQLAPAGFDIEIIEAHHKRKQDAPSGTALLLANVITSQLPGYRIQTVRTGKRADHTIGIHAVRGGGIVGEHEVRFISDFEEVSLSHRAFSRSLFAAGALSLIADIDAKVPAGRMMDLSEFLLRH
jgi:4-hydroxy-tetrahydrodipicolinate reductase